MPYDFKCIKILLKFLVLLQSDDAGNDKEDPGSLLTRGPNGAQRSEFRRTAPPDNIRCRDWPMIN